jgi:uncharacterized repeat protein (TIGR01451 family)
MNFDLDISLRWLTRVLALTPLLALLLLPATHSTPVLAEGEEFIAEWEITVEVVNGAIEAWWIGRVWEVDENGVETLLEDGVLRVNISADCTVFGDPLFGRSFVQLDGVDDYLTCKIPNIGALFGQITPALVDCRCRFEGPPYAAADVSPVLTTTAQTVIYHRQLHLEILQREDVADLELAQSPSTFAPEVGEQVAFSLTVTNHGPAPATGVIVEDKLPSGYTYVGDDSGGDYDPITGSWTVSTLAVGASATLHISVTTNAEGEYDNAAQVASSNELDPDSTPANLPLSEDDDAVANMDPNFARVRFPVVMTGPIEESALAKSANVAGEEMGVLASVAVSDTYGQAQLTLHFVTDTVPISETVFITEMVKSWQSNVFAVPQRNGIQVWAGYNAARYVDINDEDGFGDFLSADGFWNAVNGGDFVEGFFLWESEAKQKYDPDPMPAHFNLGSGTLIYVGYNPDLDTYFEGAVRAASIDPGCRGH